MSQSPLITIMARAARKAGSRLARDFGEVENLQISRKGPADFVTHADLKAEATIREELTTARPDFGFLMEESGETQGRDRTQRWIVDPLDGTTNFMHGIPQFAISIALEQNGVIVAGMIYEPATGNLWHAEKGRGAFLNDRRLRVSARTQLIDAVLATGIPHHGRHGQEQFFSILGQITPKVAGIRRFGAASLDLAYVAAGRCEGFWETGLAPWDVAAGILMVKEAGGFVTELDGREHTLKSVGILASNDGLHSTLTKEIGGAAKRFQAAHKA
jgi:myo-inositol-1(or 4)-monophosphatase